MKPFRAKGQDYELGCSISDDSLILLRTNGNLVEEHASELHAWVDNVRTAMKEVYDSNNGVVYTLIDARGLGELDAFSAKLLQEIVTHNKKYATRTAVYGLGFFHTLILETALTLANRTNMKMYQNKEEALD